jgi:hypothetical protein
MQITIIILVLLFHQSINAQDDTLKINIDSIEPIPITTEDCFNKGNPKFSIEPKLFIEQFEAIELGNRPVILFEQQGNNPIYANVFLKDTFFLSKIEVEDYCLSKKIQSSHKDFILILSEKKIHPGQLIKITYGEIIPLVLFPWNDYLIKKNLSKKKFKIFTPEYSIAVKKQSKKGILKICLSYKNKIKKMYKFKNGNLTMKSSLY